ncbi:MAG: ABC transporter permease [Myxococcota bacterium]
MISKAFQVFWVLFGATLIVTGMLRLVPGDPVDHILGEQATQQARMQLSRDLGLTDAHGVRVGYLRQYGNFIQKIATNELTSYRTREPVMSIIAGRLPYTGVLALASMLFAICLGPILGVMAAWKRGRLLDQFLRLVALLGISVPRFFFAPLLLLAFSIYWSIFPISGATDGLLSLVLPALSLGFAMAAVQMRFTRASILEVMSTDYIRTARAKGLSERVVYFKHALRNALMPVITVIGMELGSLLAGAVVVEKIFSWPGIGLLLLESIQQLDMPMVQGVVLVIAFFYVVTNLVTDWVYGLIDPRVRVS